MADQKKIIKVNDLTIEAENVHFAPIERPARPVDPLFGPRRPRVEQPQVQTELESEGQEENPTDEELQTHHQVAPHMAADARSIVHSRHALLYANALDKDAHP